MPERSRLPLGRTEKQTDNTFTAGMITAGVGTVGSGIYQYRRKGGAWWRLLFFLLMTTGSLAAGAIVTVQLQVYYDKENQKLEE